MAVGAAAEALTRLPLAPDSVAWLHSARKPVLMRTDRAQRELGWKPEHTAKATLRAMVDAHRAEPSAR
jgi:nucleoside-diphosphate-sugar epimerase